MAALPIPSALNNDPVIQRPRRLSNLLSLSPPPVTSADYPALPASPQHDSPSSPSGSFPLLQGYASSSHVFPAAFPRIPSQPWTPPASHADAMAQLPDALRHLDLRRKAHERDEFVAEPPRTDVLWSVAKRYVPVGRKRSRQGVTLVFMHCIGGHKEAWEPMLERLLAHVQSQDSSLVIDEIWSLESVQHGDSAILNEGRLGDLFDVTEYSRDMANFLQYYLPDEIRPASAPLPEGLDRLPDEVAAERVKKGFHNRQVVGVGHSAGACSLIWVACEHPEFFSSLVLVENMSFPASYAHAFDNRKFEHLILKRNWIWDTREQAEREIRKNAYYRAWAPAAVDNFLRHALHDSHPDGRWRLKTVPWHEAVMLAERRACFEAWEHMARIPRQLPIFAVWGGKSDRSGGPKMQAQTSYRRGPGAADANICLPGVGHLLPQEAPEDLADCMFVFLNSRYSHGHRRARL